MKLRDYLERNSLTTTRFAKQCGLSQPYIWQIVNGKRQPSVKAMLRIHRASKGAVTFQDLVEVAVSAHISTQEATEEENAE